MLEIPLWAWTGDLYTFSLSLFGDGAYNRPLGSLGCCDGSIQ